MSWKLLDVCFLILYSFLLSKEPPPPMPRLNCLDVLWDKCMRQGISRVRERETYTALGYLTLSYVEANKLLDAFLVLLLCGTAAWVLTWLSQWPL